MHIRSWNTDLLAATLTLAGVQLLFAGGVLAEGQPHAGEAFPGGAATSKRSIRNRNAFSHASGNLGFSQEFDFKIGNAVFRKLWVSSPASTKSSDGLGPLFNARSCQRCHLKDGRGHPPRANWPDDNAISMLMKLSIPPQTESERKALAAGRIIAVPEPTYGHQLQDTAIQGHTAEGHIHISYSEKRLTLAGGEVVSLRVPTYRITDLGYGPLHPKTMMSPRVAPPMIGLGLLETIPAADILAGADPEDKNGDGISGKASKVWSVTEKKLVLGRFGWKATKGSVPEQTAAAFQGDMGLSSNLSPEPFGDCSTRQAKCREAPHGANDNESEVPAELMRLVVFYSRNLAVPRRSNIDRSDVVRGRSLFREIGCVACHTASFTTGQSAASPHLSGQQIWPYTDLLLHDMGDGLGDGRPEGSASGSEWRTPPLWGIGLTRTVSGHTYFLHDGRARNLKEAILWHGGEAKGARDRFAKLDIADRERLIAFLDSL